MSDAAEQQTKPFRHLPMVDRDRKIVVVVDDTPESKVALRFAAGRAAHIQGGGLILFHCIRPSDFQHWVAVADRMRDEAEEEAEILLDEVSDRIHSYCGVVAEKIIVYGEPQEELKKFMDERDDLFGLVLGANPDGDPGPLVDYFSGPLVGSLKVSLMIIPGSMSYDQVDSMV